MYHDILPLDCPVYIVAHRHIARADSNSCASPNSRSHVARQYKRADLRADVAAGKLCQYGASEKPGRSGNQNVQAVNARCRRHWM